MNHNKLLTRFKTDNPDSNKPISRSVSTTTLLPCVIFFLQVSYFLLSRLNNTCFWPIFQRVGMDFGRYVCNLGTMVFEETKDIYNNFQNRKIVLLFHLFLISLMNC